MLKIFERVLFLQIFSTSSYFIPYQKFLDISKIFRSNFKNFVESRWTGHKCERGFLSLCEILSCTILFGNLFWCMSIYLGIMISDFTSENLQRHFFIVVWRGRGYLRRVRESYVWGKVLCNQQRTFRCIKHNGKKVFASVWSVKIDNETTKLKFKLPYKL